MHNLIIDGSNLFHRAYYVGKLKSKTKDKLNYHVINTCLSMIDKLGELAYVDAVYWFLFDNSQLQINYRKAIDPEYKSNRDKANTDKETYIIHNQFIEILKHRNDNYRVLLAQTLEADDLVKPLIKHINSDSILLISNDLDWSRSITDKIKWYDWNTIIDKNEYMKKYGFYPNEMAIKLYKAIQGDKADCIKKAVNISDDMMDLIMRESIEFDRFESFEKYIRLLPDTTDKFKILSNIRTIRKNYSLVDFVNIEKPIVDYIYVSKFKRVKLRLMYDAIGLSIPVYLLDKDENIFGI